MIRKLVVFSLLACLLHPAWGQHYVGNRAPLVEKDFIALPLGSIEAQGWLKDMLVRQRNGMTGRLDSLYPGVMGPRNGWLGGDGDQWERGPYWIDGLIPLAYILKDKQLIDKTQRWVEWAIASQREDGYFGPSRDYGKEKGLQRTNSEDWWPKMVAIKFLQQYYSATGDQRVLTLLTRYFGYQLRTLPTKPLGHWTFWAEYRSGDNLQAVYWLYNITGDKDLLALGELLHRQGYNYVNMFTQTDLLSKPGTIHCVNLAQGIKEPVVYYQQSGDKGLVGAVKQGFSELKKHNGFVSGMYGGDEALHGNVPTQGSELCSAVEMMYSLETMLEITGDVQFADHLEQIAFNVLPSQISDDFMTRQYFQQVNQVQITRSRRNFDIDHGQTDLLFGFLTGYPCCTSNLHQGWPKFTQNLWYATPDHGVAALVYAPSSVTMKVAPKGVEVRIEEQTCYPMDEVIGFDVSFVDKKVKTAQFPFYLRIPSWCAEAEIRVNGTVVAKERGGTIAKIDRLWSNKDKLSLTLPMNVRVSQWIENSIGIERGPLVYALKIGEKWEKKPIEDEKIYGDCYFEVTPTTPWNYGILDFPADQIDQTFRVEKIAGKNSAPNFWHPEGAPVEIKVKAKQIPSWKLYNDMAGPIPYSRVIYGYGTERLAEQEITLIPYGCTTLRIAQFPVIKEWRIFVND